MAVRTKEDILAAMRKLIGDKVDDESLAFMEDVSDTIADYDAKISDKTDWKAKYEENDLAWRTKYRDRFTSSTSDDNPEGEDDHEELPKILSFEDLFKTEG